jgi:hypothetical protein
MIYLVSNIHRSGSSMLMRCLEAGGLSVSYDKESDTMNEYAPSDYIPNPNGFYQFTNEITDQFVNLYDGKAIKCPIRDLLKLPKGEYKLVLLKRNPKEIRASMEKWTPYHSWGKDEVITYFYAEYFADLITQLTARGDMDITVLNYKNIVSDPVAEFTKISHWGVDINSMAAKVDESLYRLKLEEA